MSEEIQELSWTPPHSPDISAQITSIGEPNPNFGKTLTFRWFCCIGEAKVEKIHLSDHSYLKNNEVHVFMEPEGTFHLQHTGQKHICLFNKQFDFASVFLYSSEMLFHNARDNMIFLQDAVKSNYTDFHCFSNNASTENYYKARKCCVSFFLHLREYLSWLVYSKYNWILMSFPDKVGEDLNRFRFFLRRMIYLPEYVLHNAANVQGQKSLDASYHLFHGSLDMLWLHLTSLYQLNMCRQLADDCSQSQQSESLHTLTLEQATRALVADLVELALARFHKMDVRSLLIKSPFNCNCVAELWIMLQLLVQKSHSRGECDSFWGIIEQTIRPLLEPSGERPVKTNCMSLVQSVSTPCNNVHAFILWFLKHIAMLYTYDEKVNCSNYPLLELVVKGLLSSDVVEANMRVYLVLIEKIIIKYWNPKSEIIVLFWEHFQKRINSSFHIPGSSVDSLAIMSESVAGQVKQVKQRLSNTTNVESGDSFHMFLRILGLHLQRVNVSGQSQHWNQIRGRIYSKLSASKVQTLSEIGLYHFSSLFLTLAITADLNEVSKKLQALLCSLPMDRLEESTCCLVYRTHLSVCLLAAERGQDFTSSLVPLTTALDSQYNLPLFRTYLDGIKDILDASHCFKIDHSILIGGNWISKYLLECSPSDTNRLFEVLQTIILRVQNQVFDQVKFQNNLWQQLSVFMKQQISEDSLPQLADLGLSLSLLSLSHTDTLRDILHLFINNNSTHIVLVRRFLWQFVQKKDLWNLLKSVSPGSADSYEVLVIKSWIRCCLLSVDFKSSELCRITNFVTYLPFMENICMDLPSSTDPLKHFIVALSNKFKTAKDILVKSSLRQKMSCVLTGIDKWIEPNLKQPRSPELVTRIYHIVGLIFSLMPSFIYTKSRPSTVLKGLLDVMFLPLNAYKPDFEPSPDIKAAVAADIHLYIRGLADLNSMFNMMQDAYIDRCIEDLVKIYLPWVVGSSRCALQECVERNDRTSRLILSTICATFIKRKTSSPHQHCPQALRFLSSIATTYSRDKQVMLLLVESCFEHICDVIMFCEEVHPCKKVARNILILIFESHSFGEELSTEILTKFGILCQDHLPFLPGKLFSFFHNVLEHRPELISRLLPDLETKIKIVETKRGIQYDNSLRNHLEKLKKALECLRKGL